MTIMLELDSNQETRLRDQAEALGLAPVDYLKRVAGLENPGEIVGNEFAGQTLGGCPRRQSRNGGQRGLFWRAAFGFVHAHGQGIRGDADRGAQTAAAV